MTEDSENARLAYVTYQDIRSLGSLKEQTVIAIKAPPETRLEVPDPENVSNLNIGRKDLRWKLGLGINLIIFRLVRLVIPTLINRGEETYRAI